MDTFQKYFLGYVLVSMICFFTIIGVFSVIQPGDGSDYITGLRWNHLMLLMVLSLFSPLILFMVAMILVLILALIHALMVMICPIRIQFGRQTYMPVPSAPPAGDLKC